MDALVPIRDHMEVEELPEGWVVVESDTSMGVAIASTRPVVAICVPNTLLTSVMRLLGQHAVSAFFVGLDGAHADVRLPDANLVAVNFSHDTFLVAISHGCPIHIVDQLAVNGIVPFILRPEDWRRLSIGCDVRLREAMPSLTVDRLGTDAATLLAPFFSAANVTPPSKLGMVGMTAISVAERLAFAFLRSVVSVVQRT